MDVAYINRIISTTEKVNVDSIETYTEDYHAADFANDDQINKQATVELISDAIAGGFPPLMISVPPNSTIPFNVLAIDLIGFTDRLQWQAEIVDSGDDTTTTSVNDIRLDKHYTDNTRTEITSIDIYGHPNDTDGLTTQDALIITLFK